jgi:hypothetical protein
MWRINRPVVSKWAYAFEQEADLTTVRGRLGIFNDLIVTDNFTLANNPVNDFIAERLMSLGAFPSTFIDPFQSRLAPGDANALILRIGQNSASSYGGSFALRPFYTDLRGARAEIDLPTDLLDFKLRFWDKTGAALPVVDLAGSLSVHMWTANGKMLIRGLYRFFGPDNTWHPSCTSASGLFIESLATGGDGGGEVPIPIA